jgi:hypothetical protein
MAQYVWFNTRDVIFECRCGERKIKEESRAYGSSFSAPTFHLNRDEFKEVLNRTESEFTLIQIEIQKRVLKNLSY